MMKSIAILLSVGAMAGLSGFASAEPYVDYTPKKGILEVQMIKVDPNHIDDYLTGLKTSLVPGLEIAKKHGVLDWYAFEVKLNSNGGDANVMIVQHYPSLAVLDPDKARDQALAKESYAAVSKATQEKAVAGFDKYRTFVSDEFYGGIEYPK
jgi:hypothetical protein